MHAWVDLGRGGGGASRDFAGILVNLSRDRPSLGWQVWSGPNKGYTLNCYCLPSGHIALGNSSFTSGITGRRHLENLSCNGDEATFRDCSYTAVDMQTCSSLDSIAAVRCAVTSKFEQCNCRVLNSYSLQFVHVMHF